ncbi:hypothetical protein A2914_02310 [Candidatus Nomurabacteria bacterium RIFCSPLOWO2_01_FULL_41_21]|uniref:Uncharacterized protein n=2 Tax=Candidatus Nomuraibacteriota TaxID=1752729 RepID=A0A1F6V2L5_9BACT|nr:MAG: hypothetical protein A2733_01700 [Candidatus Nomurabacteria bacterium RIFCSPHIGHO2_01_FULL_40_20]OGI88758.1 MAG: hypothetical protein A2914_02310 [Candidatus Nomurabacteria bacterium RIFCSPLOWO2_01_FULL_41_21]
MKRIRKVVHHLRNKPEEERRHILHVTMIVICFIMVLLWTFSLGGELKDKETKEKIKQDLKPFSVLKDNLVGGYESMSGNTAPLAQ